MIKSWAVYRTETRQHIPTGTDCINTICNMSLPQATHSRAGLFHRYASAPNLRWPRNQRLSQSIHHISFHQRAGIKRVASVCCSGPHPSNDNRWRGTTAEFVSCTRVRNVMFLSMCWSKVAVMPHAVIVLMPACAPTLHGSSCRLSVAAPMLMQCVAYAC